MIIPISLLHTFLSLLILIVSIYILSKGIKSILAVTILGFVLLDSLGIAFAPYLPLSDIVYLDSPLFLINEKNEDYYFLQISSHWLFYLIALLLLILEIFINSRYTARKPRISKIRINYQYIAVLFLCIGLFAYFRYFILGPGLSILRSTQIQFSNTSSAIQARSELRNLIETGQGAYMAALSAKILFPLCSVIVLLNKGKAKYIIWFVCALLSLLYAFQTREKSPLVILMMLYAMIPLMSIFINRADANFRFDIRKITFLFFIILATFYGIGTIMYSINFGLSLGDAFDSIIARTLAIPGATEANFFFAFPEKFEFRGLNHIFKIPLMGFNGDDISIYEIAYAATGNVFATNASFLAVAWSGGGYLGVIIISIILCVSLFIIDGKLRELSYQHFVSCVLLSFPAFVGLSSGSLLDYMSWGGILSPIFLIIIFKYSSPILIANKSLNNPIVKKSAVKGSR